MPSVALATAAAVADLDPDDRALVPALADRGVHAEPAVWDDAGVDWSAYDLVVLRSTWDYAPRRDAFVAWARRVAEVTRLANPADLVAWNTDKHYLGDLEAAGVPVVPTTFLEPGEPAVAERLRAAADGELVVKPAVSAGSKDTARYASDELERASAHATALLAAGRAVMAQPYLASIDTEGESALLYLGGSWSHAVRKAPLLQLGAGFVEDLYAEEQIDPLAVTDRQREVADRTLAAVPGGSDRLLYARVDLLDDPRRGPVLLELELVEPSLWLATAPGAAERLADAIVGRLG